MSSVRLPSILAVVVLSFAPSVVAQAPQMPPALKAAQDLFQAQKWAEAAAAYETIIKTDKIDPRPRAGLAAALYALGQYERALPASLEANRMIAKPQTQIDFPNLPPGNVMLRAVRIYNKLGRSNDAFAWLTKMTSAGYANLSALESEPDLTNLRTDARWKAIVDAVKANIDPCGSRPEFRQFDFWVGDWDVLGGSGQKVGSSHVERILNNCVVHETYTAAPGASAVPNYVGQAFHFFDATSKKWVQHYIDTQATPWDWVGEFKDGAIRYTREGPFGPAGSNIRQRMTFTPQADGKVRQLFEQSADNGKTWRAGFDGMYAKRSGALVGGRP